MSNVRDFGAGGDGKTDDTDAIQHAIDQGDGIVEFPRGDYRVTKTIQIDLQKVSRISLDGMGGTAKILSEANGATFAFKGTHASTADPAGFRPEEWKRERMPMVKDLEIEGRTKNTDGVSFEGVMQPTLCGVLIREVRNCVHLKSRNRNLIIDHCHFYHNTGIGVFFDEVNLHQAVITGSHISYCRLGGIRIENSEVRNLQIVGNDIEYNNARSHKDFDDEPTAEIYIDVGEKGSVREGTISGNTIQATYSENGANIRLIGNAKTSEENHRAGMWTIGNNLIGSQNNNIHLTSVRGIAISGNYIYSGHHRNILVENSRNIVIGPNCMGHNPDYRKNELATGIRIESSENVNINGLLIEDAEAGKHTVPNVVQIERDALLEIIKSKRVNVSGCQILDPTPCGVLIKDCSDTSLNGCTILDDRSPQKMKNAILWAGSQKGNMLSNCRIGSGLEKSKIDDTVTQSGNLIDD